MLFFTALMGSPAYVRNAYLRWGGGGGGSWSCLGGAALAAAAAAAGRSGRGA